jgi:Kef-type K+ transport system membrane component KefB
MQISVGLFLAKWKVIVASIVALLVGKLAVMMAAGQMFGLSRMASLRSGARREGAGSSSRQPLGAPSMCSL